MRREAPLKLGELFRGAGMAHGAEKENKEECNIDFNYIKFMYSTLGGKTDKLDEAVNRELDITRS